VAIFGKGSMDLRPPAATAGAIGSAVGVESAYRPVLQVPEKREREDREQ
jgi:hypothetical protein